MKKYLKPIIAFSIVLIGTVFIKLGNLNDFWSIAISSLGCIVVFLPAFFWYKDKLNM